MFSAATIRNRLGASVTRCRLHVQGGFPSRRYDTILFWTEGTVPQDDTVYILSTENLYTLPQSETESLFLCAGAFDNTGLDGLTRSLNVILTNLSLAELGNRVLQLLAESRALAESYHQALRAESPLHVLLERGSSHLNSPLLLLSGSFSRLEGEFLSPVCNEPLLEQLRTEGALDMQTVRELMHGLQPLADGSVYSEYVLPATRRHCLLRRITSRGVLIGYLFLPVPEPEQVNVYLDELEELAGYVQQGVKRNQVRSCELNGPFNDLVQDVLTGRLTGRDHIAERVAAIPALRGGDRFSLVTISFEETSCDLPWDLFAGQLWNLFPFSNLVLYERRLLVFAKAAENGKALCDEEKLQSFLEEHRAFAGIGTSTKYLSALPTMYQQCCAAVRFGSIMYGDRQGRIFRYENFSVYLFIEMCANQYFSDFHHGRLYFLCHQDFLNVARFDRKNRTDYLEVLYAYLSNNCKATQTARVLYMHRNTLLSKIEKIEQIIGKSLDDNFLRERLLFSYHVMEYAEKYLHSDIFPQSNID